MAPLTGRLLRRDLLLLAGIGLLVQGVWAWQLREPSHMDAYYYLTNGARLAEGYGLTEQVVWQFLDAPPAADPLWPVPSHSYWQPLPSFLAALGLLTGGGFRGAQLPFWLLTGTLPLLAYAISRTLDGRRGYAWLAGLLTAAGGFFTPLWNQPETFAPFAWAGGGALLAAALALTTANVRRANGLWLLAGVGAGLAHLTRADGLLLLGAVGLAWLTALLRGRGQRRLAPGLLLGAGYLLIMGGWLLRGWLVFGRPLSTAGTQTIFLTTYDDLFAFGRTFSAATFLEWGAANILRSRLQGLSAAAQTFVAVCGLIFLAPLILAGWPSRDPQRRQRLAPLGWYAALLFGVMSLVFTFPGLRGGLFHSATALWPWFMALAPAGLARAIGAVARRRPSWQPAQALPIFSAAAVILAFGLTFFVADVRGQRDAVAADQYPLLDALLPADAVVIVRNPPAFYHATGRSALSVPNEPPEVLPALAARYDATYLLLDADHPLPLTDLYRGTVAPDWLIPLPAPGDGLRLFRIVGP